MKDSSEKSINSNVGSHLSRPDASEDLDLHSLENAVSVKKDCRDAVRRTPRDGPQILNPGSFLDLVFRPADTAAPFDFLGHASLRI